MSLSNRLRDLGLGRLVYLVYHRPRSKIRDILRAGGPLVMRRTEAGRLGMVAAASTLPDLPPADNTLPSVELHVLTGRKFWYQTNFCLWTFARESKRRVIPAIYDDGTLDESSLAPLRRHFPDLRFIPQTETIARLDKYLPSERYPHLRERWANYPNLRKLIDVHLASHGWKLVIDSDMLFYRKPEFLLRWLDKPEHPLHGVDCMESYGYSRKLMQELTGGPLPSLVNVGLCGLKSEEIDWDLLERWTATLIARERTNYYLEQALVAMLVAGRDCAVAPALDYVTLPGKSECLKPTAVMHHYVDTAKRWYFTDCWRQASRLRPAG